MTAPLLRVSGLVTQFPAEPMPVRAVDGLSLSVAAGETLGLVGESGCGKSVTALSLLRLVPPPGRIVSGEIWWKGEEVLAEPIARFRRRRGGQLALIFQEPLAALNPVFTVGEQVAEVCRLHVASTRREARQRALELLQRVELPAPERSARQYPHQLSGGMRQRVMIAMALAGSPELLIADEPTTSLDVTVQAQILDLLRSLQEERGMALLLISHDLGLVVENCDRVAVMYAGREIEEASAERIFREPRHPYTAGLLRALPQRALPHTPLEVLAAAADAGAPSAGCAYAPRCPLVEERCRVEVPGLRVLGEGQAVACHLVDEGPP